MSGTVSRPSLSSSLSILTPPFLAGLSPDPSSINNFLSSSTKTFGSLFFDIDVGIRSGAMAMHLSSMSVVCDGTAWAVQSLSVLNPPRMTSPHARGIVSCRRYATISGAKSFSQSTTILTCPVSGRRAPGHSMPIPRSSDEQHLTTDRVTILILHTAEVSCAETSANDDGIRFSRDNRDLKLGDMRQSESDELAA